MHFRVTPYHKPKSLKEKKDDKIKRLRRERDDYKKALYFAISLIPEENMTQGMKNAIAWQK